GAFVGNDGFVVWARRGRLSAARGARLAGVLAYRPSLGNLRRFADALYRLFDRAQTAAQAWHRWEQVTTEPAYRDDPSLRPVWGLLAAGTFRKVIAFLSSPAGARQRTNNHAERTNRGLRREGRARPRPAPGRGGGRFLLPPPPPPPGPPPARGGGAGRRRPPRRAGAGRGGGGAGARRRRRHGQTRGGAAGGGGRRRS